MAALLLAAPASAQQSITLSAAIRKAGASYPALRASRLREGSMRALQRSASPLGDLELSSGGEEIGHGNDAITTLVEARQNLDLFSVRSRRRRMAQETQVAAADTRLQERRIRWQLSLDYAADVVARMRLEQYRRQEKLYSDFVAAAKLRYDTEAASLLEYQAAQSRQRQVELALIEAENDLNKAHINLSRWLSSDTLYQASGDIDEALTAAPDTLALHPALSLAEERVHLAEAVSSETRSSALPRMFVGMGSQKIGSRTGYWSWQVGLSLPVSIGTNRALRRAAALDTEKARADLQTEQRTLSSGLRSLERRSTVD